MLTTLIVILLVAIIACLAPDATAALVECLAKIIWYGGIIVLVVWLFNT